MPAFSASDAAITVEASPQPVAHAANLETLTELIDFAPEVDVDYAETFDFETGPIAEPLVTADVAQLALAAAAADLSFAARNSRFQNIAKLDLAANGLGPTNVVKRDKSRSDIGLDFKILGVFLLILVTVLVALVVARWRLI